MSISGEQLRADIDSGKTGEKVAYPDPAAAPLGTDAEAGGAPTTAFPEERREVKLAPRRRHARGLAMFLSLGFAVDFCIFVSVLIGAT
jgi:hypothetical protein